MANTGYKQATIAFKVSKPEGLPLDIDGELTSVSGRRQAIALLTGTINPNPALYEVELYFIQGAPVQGAPTTAYDATTCPVGYIAVNPSFVTLLDDPVTFTLESSGAWILESFPPGIATIDYTSGGAGIFTITLTKTATLGQGPYVFKALGTNQTAEIWVANVDATPWLLDTGEWNMLGFWFDNGIWNF